MQKLIDDIALVIRELDLSRVEENKHPGSKVEETKKKKEKIAIKKKKFQLL